MELENFEKRTQHMEFELTEAEFKNAVTIFDRFFEDGASLKITCEEKAVKVNELNINK
jgi:hypothetical protein